MANITPELNVCLKSQDAPLVLKKEYNVEKINSFLQEAYNINARITDLTKSLRSIRPRYLSTAPPSQRRANKDSAQTRPLTDSERDALDASSKQLLRDLNNAITRLQQAESIRLQTADSVALSKRARRGLGALGRWAAGGAVTAKSDEEAREEGERKQVAAVRESVLFYVQKKLEEAGRVQSEMMEVRLSREVEKSKSALYKSRMGGAGIPYAAEEDGMNGAVAGQKGQDKRKGARSSYDEHRSQLDQEDGELSQDQMQIFAQENNDLLRHYEDTLDQVRAAERSILEISELHGTLHANLAQQSEHIEQLVQDSYSTTENVGGGNKELKRASERRSTAKLIFWSTVGFCSTLVIWDLVF
ncbi:hypothetical protein MBLNU230_g0730t1 [Neophaeotheca triangularis]